MFDFTTFYRGLLNRTDYFNNYWKQFPPGRLKRFKTQTLALLKENILNKDRKGLSSTLAVMFYDGADEDFTNLLLLLLDEKWHKLEEDIVTILEIIKDPKTVDKLYDMAINVPINDEMRALAKKCMAALFSIHTPESLSKLKLLQKSDDQTIKDNATFYLDEGS